MYFNYCYKPHTMERSLEICMVNGVMIRTYMDNPCPTKPPLKPSTVKPLFSCNVKGSRLIACHSSLNQVEVVTACSWTEMVVAADMPVLVEFWAPLHGQCQVVDEVAKEYAGKALCYRLNIDEYPNVAVQYGITSIPSVLFYNNGENKEIVIGDHVSKSTLCGTLDKYIYID